MIPGVPEGLPDWVRSVRDARRWLACEYRRQGYAVVEDPTPDDLPAEVWEYHLDLYAHRPGHGIAAVIRRRDDLSENTMALARLLKGRPDWRFDIIVLPSPVRDRDRSRAERDLAAVS